MNNTVISRSLRRAGSLVVTGLCLGLSAPASAGFWTLTVGNSQINGDPNVSPLAGFKVDGVEHIENQRFYFRLVDGVGEDRANVLTEVAQGQIGANMFAYQRGEKGVEGDPLRIFVKYTLLDQPLGPGSAALIEEVSVKNIASKKLDLSWFELTDWDLDDSSSNEVAKTTTAFGMQGILQEDHNGIIQSLILAPSGSEPDFWEIGNSLLAQSLNDGMTTTLDTAFGTPIPLFGPADIRHAFQWNRSLQPDEIFSYTKFKVIGPNLVVEVPEPGTLALFGLGLAGLGFARRRKKQAA